MKWVAQISRFLVGGLFTFSGLIKINDPVGTAIKLEEYFDVFSTDITSFFSIFEPISLFLSVVLCVMEVALGVAVLLNYRMKKTAWILLSLIVFFTFLTFYSAYFNKVTDCGCFGDAIKLTPWESFTKDIILLIFSVIIFFNRDQYQQQLSFKVADMVVALVIVLNTLVAIYAIRHLPYIDFRSYKVGANIPELMLPSEDLKYQYVMTKDGQEKTFTDYPTDGGYEFKEMVLLNPEAQPKITDYSVWNNEGDITQNTFEGNKLLIIMYNVQKANTNSLEAIKSLTENLPSGVSPMILTASGEEPYEAFRHEYQLAIPYYFADATVLKTIIRSNPGIVLLKDGIVQGKWHFRDTPSPEEVTNKLR